MGSEDLFRKRTAKKNKELSRKEKNKRSLDKILIVCEGSKTEPIYFLECRSFHKLETAKVIEVTGDCGSDPRSVFNKAKELYQSSVNNCAPFDKVYCVIDRDAHPNYLETLDAINKKSPKGVFTAISSVPCFEYWLLLHYTYTTKAYAKTPRKSSGAQVLQDLKKYIPKYEKGQHGLFTKLSGLIDTAMKNSERAYNTSLKNNTDNPSSKIHDLIKHLLQIKQDLEEMKR
jgi:hypothetical protein